jgi:ATPase complex subunit ATP10
VQDGFVYKLLKPAIVAGFRRNLPEDAHHRTVLHFGEHQNLLDGLRAHNTLTGYVFLLDGIGRVRWASSGEATEAEVRGMIEAAKDLTPPSSKAVQGRKRTRTGQR